MVISQFNTLSLSVNSLEQNFLLRTRNNKDANRRHTNFIMANAIATTCCNRLFDLPDFGCNNFVACRKHGSLSRDIQGELEAILLVQ